MILNILFENKDFLAISKPFDISFHDEAGDGFFKLVKETYPGAHSVHRLDKVTSGILIIALNSKTASRFSELFRDRLIDKYYIALSRNKPKKKQGMIKGDLDKSRRGSFKLLKTKFNPSITQFFSFSIKAGLRLFILKPYTGKTHQLRVAMKSLSSPILGDKLYAGDDADRAYLHAYAISFELGGKLYEIFDKELVGEYWPEVSQFFDKPSELNWPKI